MPAKVLVAALCKRTSQNEEGYLSLHSIVHGVTILDEGPAGLDLLAVVRVMSDEQEICPFRLAVVSPSGSLASPEVRMDLDLGRYRPKTMSFDIQVQPEEEGFFWLEVEVGEEPMTRIPLGVDGRPIQGDPDERVLVRGFVGRHVAMILHVGTT